jgi:DMSO/TMAO reductase YedYZ molybdopterin-dependent catalytic subunit
MGFLKIIYAIFCVIFLILFSGCLSSTPSNTYDTEISRNQTETKNYQGVDLTPIDQQQTRDIKGTPNINIESYRLQINGMVENPENFTYEQIKSYPNVSKVIDLNCVEGWSFTAKWTGIPLKTLFNETGVKDNAINVVFYSADGYSTSLKLDYLMDNNIILAYKINDVILPRDRGFPLQLVAESKYGYKWAKWITEIEVTNQSYEGYWEKRGYNNSANVSGPSF